MVRKGAMRMSWGRPKRGTAGKRKGHAKGTRGKEERKWTGKKEQSSVQRVGNVNPTGD
jgi:hypothetical protein